MLDGLPLHATKLQLYNMQLSCGRKPSLPGINKKTNDSHLMPPVVAITRGAKEACFTSLT